MKILGIHHISLVCANAQRMLDFYTRVLGQRLVKRTVNYDDPSMYHLYFGDATGRPATAITYFEHRSAQLGAEGIGGTHHFAIAVNDYDGLLKWKRRLTDLGIAVRGPYDRKYFTSIYFDDPDGGIIEIATKGPGFTVDEPLETLGEADQMPPNEHTHIVRSEEEIAALTWPDAVPDITPDMALNSGMHHITAICSDIQRTHDFYHGLLEMPLVKRTFNFDDLKSRHWYWGVDGGQPGTLITYFERDRKTNSRARYGTGRTHHFALAVADADEQLAWRERLVAAGLSVTEVKDRTYFKSIYTRDPDGHIIEIATVGPGFTVDEPVESLGSALMLPPSFEPQRASIEAELSPLSVPAWSNHP